MDSFETLWFLPVQSTLKTNECGDYLVKIISGYFGVLKTFSCFNLCFKVLLCLLLIVEVMRHDSDESDIENKPPAGDRNKTKKPTRRTVSPKVVKNTE